MFNLLKKFLKLFGIEIGCYGCGGSLKGSQHNKVMLVNRNPPEMIEVRICDNCHDIMQRYTEYLEDDD